MNANEVKPRPTDSSSPLHFHIRSCSSCRQRKVKCDRQRPCTNCIRSGVECVYPPGRGRAPKRPRGALNVQLSQRLSRLETIIRSFETPENQRGSTLNPMGPALRSSTMEKGAPQDHQLRPGHYTSNLDPELSIEQRLGRLLINETQSYYVSNVLWANLGDEVCRWLRAPTRGPIEVLTV